jgi:hypothetical protein
MTTEKTTAANEVGDQRLVLPCPFCGSPPVRKVVNDTPRTDEAEEESFRAHNNSISARAAGWEFARGLERALNEMTTKQIELVKHLNLYRGQLNNEGKHTAADALANV